MRLLKIVTGPDEESHFEEAEVSFEPMGALACSALWPALGAGFRHFPPGFASDFHAVGMRELTILIAGEADYEVSDGEVRRLGPGSVLLMEDTSGKGHRSRNVGAAERITLFLPLEEGSVGAVSSSEALKGV
ncbi:cupin domain-containing protein [Stigmatella hybrida]|uniref:hypothetical protein n=1 Tax=Stigmatella hybrida TaxID=394097 RepID=UPI001CDB286E|nr:hypothetical protein [Stigmatella hybrida]